MKFKNGILILGLLAMITACGESAEEKALREIEEGFEDFNREMKSLENDWNREMEKAQKEWDREMKNYGY